MQIREREREREKERERGGGRWVALSAHYFHFRFPLLDIINFIHESIAYM